MRTGLSPVEFFLKCKRKPKQQELLDRIETLTQEDIDNSGQPQWVRKALTELKKRNGITARQSAEVLAQQMQDSHMQAPDPTFPVYRWTRAPIEVKPQKGMSLEILPRELMLVDTNRNEIKIDYSILSLTYAKIQEITSQAEIVGMMTHRQFIEFVAQDKQRRL